MKKTLLFVITLLLLASLVLVGCNTGAAAEETTTENQEEAVEESAEKVIIRWYVGLGAGSEPENIPGQEALVEAFNESRDDIEIVIEFVDYEQAVDILSTQIAGGNPPDIIGPVGWSGVNPFEGLWLDMEPYLEGYDFSDFSDAAVESYRLEEGLVGLPFAMYPSGIFYNRDLFDEAGLEYPPAEWGADYADGEPWDVAKMEELALLLTVDANGNDATNPEFDAEDIIQFGYHTVWSDGLKMDCAAIFGAGNVVDADGNAYISDEWKACVNWYYTAIHEQHIVPNETYELSDLLSNDNTFDSGNVAMAGSHLWYTCCNTSVENWDVAAVPSYNGVLTSKMNADTFRVLASTKHPEETMEVIKWMTGEAAPELLQIYGGMPARESLQEDFFTEMDENFPQGVNWQVFIDGLAYPDVPNNEANMPNYSKAYDRLHAFKTLYHSDPDLDISAEIETLISDLQSIFDEVK
ncbi:MAG: extracellular solute-binding protein [Anaerolineaceae bacterium]|nr:extracellular solute-binding protein [Anaerolineaceae bacterium]